MTALEEMEAREKIINYNRLQDGPVSEYYAENEDRLVNDLKFDRGLPSAMVGNFEGDAIRRTQALIEANGTGPWGRRCGQKGVAPSWAQNLIAARK